MKGTLKGVTLRSITLCKAPKLPKTMKYFFSFETITQIPIPAKYLLFPISQYYLRENTIIYLQKYFLFSVCTLTKHKGTFLYPSKYIMFRLKLLTTLALFANLFICKYFYFYKSLIGFLEDILTYGPITISYGVRSHLYHILWSRRAILD